MEREKREEKGNLKTPGMWARSSNRHMRFSFFTSSSTSAFMSCPLLVLPSHLNNTFVGTTYLVSGSITPFSSNTAEVHRMFVNKKTTRKEKWKWNEKKRTISLCGGTHNFPVVNQEPPSVGHIIKRLWRVNLAEGQRQFWRDQLAVFNSGGNLVRWHIGEALADESRSIQQEFLAIDHRLSGHLQAK